jgi:NAD(P)-dependent dehydrogenase (short-subunit alcohol dehydrogenase family)
MDRILEGKVALVTGGATGIGEAICKIFARHGAKVVVNGYPGDPVAGVVKEINRAGGTAIGVVADVGTAAGAHVCVDAALDDFGKLDILVANAGVLPEFAELQDFPVQSFHEVMHSNVMGTFHIVRASLPALRETRGCIVAAGSEAGLRAFPMGVCYGATKGWIIAFIRGLAIEQAKYGIRANVVAPGPIDTEMTRAGVGNIDEETEKELAQTDPMGRRGTPEEAANVFLFLASDLASYVNAAVYTVDGGETAATGTPGAEARPFVKRPPPGTVELRHQFDGRARLQ